MKKLHQVMTRAVSHKFEPGEQMALIGAFQSLIQGFPKEYHFAIHLCGANEGKGEKVWYIIDESEEERIETMLFPEDY